MRRSEEITHNLKKLLDSGDNTLAILEPVVEKAIQTQYESAKHLKHLKDLMQIVGRESPDKEAS